MSVAKQVASLHDRGFDKSGTVGPCEDGTFFARVGCSQCQAAVICGVPCHEHGCPNAAAINDEEDDDEAGPG